MPFIFQPAIPVIWYPQPFPGTLPPPPPGPGSGLTHIVDTLWKAVGTSATPGKASGTINLSWPTFQTSGGDINLAGQTTIEISNGVLDIYLQPNDTATPAGTYYVARYALTDGLELTELWYVRTELGVVKLGAVRVLPEIIPCPACGS